jgi:hypothetical protein
MKRANFDRIKKIMEELDQMEKELRILKNTDLVITIKVRETGETLNYNNKYNNVLKSAGVDGPYTSTNILYAAISEIEVEKKKLEKELESL